MITCTAHNSMQRTAPRAAADAERETAMSYRSLRRSRTRGVACLGAWLVIASVGYAGPDSAWGSSRDQERARDREVLEAVIAEKLDPASPWNRAHIENRGRPGKQLIFNRYTLHSEDPGYLSAMDALTVKGLIPSGAASDLRRRNLAGPFTIEPLGIQLKDVIFDDLDQLAQKSGPGFAFARAFWEKYPESWGFVSVYLPGYSLDGKLAILVLDSGPTPHGMVEIYLLAWIDGLWKVGDRWQQFFQ